MTNETLMWLERGETFSGIFCPRIIFVTAAAIYSQHVMCQPPRLALWVKLFDVPSLSLYSLDLVCQNLRAKILRPREFMWVVWAKSQTLCLAVTPTAGIRKAGVGKLDSSELKMSAPWKGWKDKLQTRRKYLQITYPTRDLYWAYIKNSQNSTTRNKQTYKNNPIRKFTKDTNGQFIVEDTYMANKLRKRWLT